MAEDIKKLLESGKLLIGTDRTLKHLKRGELRKVLLASNTKKETAEDIKHFADIAETEVEDTGKTNEELGTICRKSFSISALGVLK